MEYAKMKKLTDSYYTTEVRKKRVSVLANALERSRSWVINKCLEIALPLLETNQQPQQKAANDN